jgi:hypothetical protein
MMPVIRISDETYAHLQRHAKAFEDTTPESVIIKALAALDMFDGDVPSPAKAPIKRSEAPKLPQKEFRLPLLMTLLRFGGKAQAKDVRTFLGPIMAPKLREGDFESVSTGDPRWWNAICWERNDLIKEGLVRSDSERGVWEISELGRSLDASLMEGAVDQNGPGAELASGPLHEMATMYWRQDMGGGAVKVADALFDPILFRSVDEFELPVRSSNCLKNDNVVYIGDLVQLSEAELLRTPNMGRLPITEIKEELKKYGLKLGTQLPGGPVKFADVIKDAKDAQPTI